MTGYYTGPAITNGFDCTGAEANIVGCKYGCHSSNADTAINLKIELLDSTGGTTTTYKGGGNYTVRLTGKNNTLNILPKFGFQIGSILGSTAGISAINAGIWAPPFPINTHYAAPAATYYVVGLVEQSQALVTTTGVGGQGSTYIETLNWTAPPIGTGTVSIWGVLNAVNDNSAADSGDLWDTTHVVINEWTESTLGISSIESDKNFITILPNPFSNQTTLYLNREYKNVSLKIINSLGKEVKTINFFGKEITIEKAELNSGIYFIQVFSEKEIIGTKKVVIQ